MSSIYDWVSLAIFAGLVVLFLQRSTGDRPEEDVSLFYYLGAAAGCAVGNYLGNHGQGILGALVLAVTVGFIVYFLKPFHFSHRR